MEGYEDNMPLQKVVAKFYQVTCDECQKPYNLRVKKFDAFVKSEVKKEFMKTGWDFTGYPRTVCPLCTKKIKELQTPVGKQKAVNATIKKAEEKAGLQKEVEKA